MFENSVSSGNREIEMPVTADSAGPYASISGINLILDHNRKRGFQKVIDADVLRRIGISDSLLPRTLQSLQALDLIGEDGSPTNVLEGLRQSPEADYQQKLQEWLKGAYADVFEYTDPAVDSETKIRDAFRSYTPTGQQDRMTTLFIGLCVAAGLREESTKVRKPRSATAKKTPAANAGLTITSSRKTTSAAGPTGIPAALVGLLQSLPDEGSVWSQHKRDKFVSTFETVLDFCFEIGEETDNTDAEEN